MNLGQLIITLGVDASQLYTTEAKVKASMHSMQASANQAAARIQTAGRHMMNFYSYGYRATRMITLPLVALGTAAVKTYKDFEFAMNKIIGLVGIAQEKVGKWYNYMLEMGPKISRSPKELAEGLYFVTSAGFKSARALDIIEIAGKGAAAGLGKTADVANVLTSAMNAYRATGLSAAKAMDQLIAAVREGKAYPEDFAKSLGKVLPIAANLQVSFDQVTGAMAAMTLQGASATQAATYLSGVLRALLKPSQQSRDALEDLGTSAEEMRDILGRKGLIAVLLKINKLTKEYGSELVSKVFPRVRAITGVLSLMGQNYEYNYKVMQEVKNAHGDLRRAVEAASSTFQYQWNAAISGLNVSMIKLGKSIGKTLIPILKSLTGTVNKIVDWFDSLDEKTRVLIVKIGMLVAASGPLYLMFGFLLGNILPGLIRILSKVLIPVLGILINLIVQVGRALLASFGPIGAVIAIIGMFVGALVLSNSTLKKSKKALSDYADEADKAIKKIKTISNTDIGTLMNSLDVMDKNQLQDLKYRTEEKIKQEKAYTTTVIAEARKRIRDSKELLDLRRRIEEAPNKIGKISAQAAYFNKEKELISDLSKQFNIHVKTKKEYEEYLKLIDEEIAKRKKLEAGAGGGPKIDEVLFRVTSQLKRDMKVVTTRSDVLGGRFDDIKEKTSLWTKALDELTDRLGRSKKHIPGLREEIDKLIGDLDRVEKIQFSRALDEISIKAKYLGKDFNANAEYAKAYSDRMDTLIHRLNLAKQKFGENSKEVIELETRIAALSEQTKEYTIAAANEEIQRQVEYSKALSNSLGTWASKQDLLNAQIKKTSTGLYQLFLAERVNTKEWDNLITKLDQATRKLQEFSDETSIKFLKALVESTGNFSIQMEVVQTKIQKVNNELKDIASHGGIGSDAWKEGIKQLREYSLELDKLEASQQILNTLRESAVNFIAEIGTVIGKTLSGVENAWTSLVDIFLRTAQQILKVMLGIAIMAKLMWGAMIPGELIFGLIGISALLAVWENYKSSLDNEVKLAKGGIVTRPTLAMIGEGSRPEAVIPLDRINSLFSGEVKFKIEDDALVGILEQYENRRKNW